jgi:hypothetical protein
MRGENLETLMLVDDKEEKKAADNEVVDTVSQPKEPTNKARGRPAASVASVASAATATASAGNKNKKNNKVIDAPPCRAATHGAAACK